LPDRGVEPAGRDDLVPELDLVLHGGVRALTAPRGQHEQPPDGDQDHDQDQESGHCSLSSRSRLYAANVPATIASRAPRVSSSANRRLWSDSSRNPKSSFWFTRWRMYARVKRVQAGQSQPSSSGRSSRAWRAFRRLILPVAVSALPVRAVRVGNTQSN